MPPEFETFLTTRVPEKHQPTARALIALITRVAPELTPGMRGGTENYIPVPVWRLGTDRLALSPSQKGITLSFANGAGFDDPEGLLGGAGKRSRTILFRTEAETANPALIPLLRQVVESAGR